VEVVGHDDDTHAAPLHRVDERAEIAVSGEQHHPIDMRRNLHGIDGKLDVHVALNFAPPALIDLCRLGDDGVPVVVKPIDQRPD
jgi:hypothetical protein